MFIIQLFYYTDINYYFQEYNLSYIIILLSAFFAAGLTFFSGFGLATVLTPVLILFFPAPIAISLTAIVHFLNNIFKLILTGRNINKEILLKFGITAMVGAVLGSSTLVMIAQKNFIISYHLFNHSFKVELVNFTIGVIILVFVLVEMLPEINKSSINKNLLPIGGVLSGFFGGLSGHQGAFRSLFLIKCNLSKEQFVATGILIACLVDVIRLSIYGVNFSNMGIGKDINLLFLTIFSAFLGSYIANKHMQKITINLIRNIVVGLLLFISLGLITGLI